MEIFGCPRLCLDCPIRKVIASEPVTMTVVGFTRAEALQSGEQIKKVVDIPEDLRPSEIVGLVLISGDDQHHSFPFYARHSDIASDRISTVFEQCADLPQPTTSSAQFKKTTGCVALTLLNSVRN